MERKKVSNALNLFTISEVCKILKLGRTNVSNLINCGEITATKLGKNSVRVSESSLIKYLKKCEIKIEDGTIFEFGDE